MKRSRTLKGTSAHLINPTAGSALPGHDMGEIPCRQWHQAAAALASLWMESIPVHDREGRPRSRWKPTWLLVPRASAMDHHVGGRVSAGTGQWPLRAPAVWESGLPGCCFRALARSRT
jgi:hypothetical protein